MAPKLTYEELEFKISRLESERAELQDIEDKSRSAMRMSKLSNEYTKVLVRENSELTLLTKICQTIVETGGHIGAWLAFAETDEAQSVRAITQMGFEDDYLDSIKISWSETGFRAYPTSAAIRTGASQSWNISHCDASALPWQKEAERSGYAASLALPLVIDHQVFAALTICACEVDAFDNEVVLFWEALADDLSFSIQRLRKEVRQREIEQSLRKKQERDALAHQAAKMGTWEWDIRTGSLDWSKQIYPLFGVVPENFDTTYEAFLQCIPPEDRIHVEASVHAAVYEGKSYDIEHTVRRPDGSLRWVSERGNVVKDEAGNPIRMLGVVQDITERKQLREQEKSLSGMMPICSNCKKIRDTLGRWHKIETYIRDHSSTRFSHSICPECAKKLYPDYDLNI